ncbi:UDP-glucose 4-epimerase [Amycolatopsis bartoniae]|uniref:UDP-glucose 4-epimerase n=1 Tax=Amycolatopsis bartoniae TaxID=941986 RepID=A0A8H9MFF1_9PSEU|nr:UDP-glucose 4-epimerase GalE [Amycolatopsis bartoniae]MBB2937522.1 UDP-glucose 4-epimerase [Amycolatopsis bartoniae]TVT05960.1 UDP-glucose 4-epimerase GalE [Amycolatopsis bartoniae]GHF81924.1 UDP-glucose 4-epimerase GalE [Amycolatopsis bartoniae]
MALKLIVTGGAGYVGSVCAARLIESGHEVVVVDDLSTGHADAVPDGARFVEGDAAEATASLLGEGFDGVLHFAAKSLVGESMTDPAKYWHGNVLTSIRLLDAMRDNGTPRLVFSSTAATYGEPESSPIRETAPTQPTNTYGASKLAIDHAITSYARAHGLAAVSLRYFNVAGAYGRYGERHTTETHLIPLVLQVASGDREQVQIFGDDYPTEDGTAVRDYIHVVDLADAHLLALQHAVAGEHRIYNLGNGTGFSVQQVIQTCRDVTGHPIPATLAPRRTGDPAVLVAASDRAREELGWKPERADLSGIVGDAWRFAQERRQG